MTGALEVALGRSNYAAAVKVIDQHIKVAQAAEDQDGLLAQLLCNRALCYQLMQLYRKAQKDYQAVLKTSPHHLGALVQYGKVLHILKRPEEALQLWQTACSIVQPSSDLALAIEAYALVQDPAHALQTPLPGPSAPATAGADSDDAGGAPATPKSPPPAAQAAIHATNGVANGTASTSGPSTPIKQQPKPAKPATSAVAAALVQHPDLAVSDAINKINSGKVDDAEALLDALVDASSTPIFGAHLARGTARALKRELKGAVEDFSIGIDLVPQYSDTWKRRGQAQAALGEHAGALSDLRRAINLTTPGPQQADAYLECGMIYQKERDFRRATKELAEATRLDPQLAQAWNLLGLCRTSQGDIEEGVKAYKKALKLNPQLKDAWINMAQAMKEVGSTKEAEEAFSKGIALKGQDGSNVGHALKAMAEMRRGCGDHRGAIRILDKAVEKAKEAQLLDLLLLRGACYHALGEHKAAVDDYEKVFHADSKQLSDDGQVQQVMAFYLREMAQYLRANIDHPVESFCLDKDLHPAFKELWCKKMPPSEQMVGTYRLQPPIPANPAVPPPRPSPAQLDPLVNMADAMGNLLRYHHQGFLPNKRQLRSGGLAAIELAQLVRRVVTAHLEGRDFFVPKAGASAVTSGSGQHGFCWRDAMDIPVKWRQLSEPNDQVVWVDLLTRSEFEAGFGSHTPMFTGQTKCVRYSMNFSRAMQLLKEVLAEEGKAYDAHNNPIPLAGEDRQAAIQSAMTAEDMWCAIGKDSWVVVPIASSSRAEHVMEGTRLTMVKMPDQPDSYEFSIRTPVTPPRWDDYDKELTSLWKLVMVAFVEDNKPLIAERVLQFVYYWYNFMPLARGTAAVGYITILGLFLAAGMPITASIPQNYQTDWEAILAREPATFIAAVSPWLLPAAARPDSQSGVDTASANTLAAVSDLREVLPTSRARLEALNLPHTGRI